MGDAATQLIDAFASLPPHERHSVLIELVRISETDAGPISDEELTFAGAEVFAMYDSEEEPRGNAETR
jgi:hypothetical protein